ncbi:MAG TPA: NADH-quinone oxidoreductase subunit N [Gemmatimonadaceae bacterium]|nr:NADH-quinone oxidoreductase subunit N [Gemmatimonadaceae bacterium]
MPIDLTQPGSLLVALLPDLVLAIGAMILLLVAAWRPASVEHQRTVGVGAVVVALLTLATVVYMGMRGDTAAAGPIAVDDFRWAADAVILVGAVLTLLMSIEYQAREEILTAESHVLVLLATSGMMLLVAARDLTLVFLGIELMSVATYVLVATNRRSARSAEGALKYFLLGAFSTGFLLYGAALIYGATGTTGYAGITAALEAGGLANPLVKPGLALLVVGFGFKVAAAPFHMWAPDAYEGAPTPVTAFMAATVKAAALAAFMRIFVEAFGAALVEWHFALWWLAAITMVVGNVVALAQRNLKRMLAYSSIAHAGYLLVAVVVGVGRGPATGITGSGALLFYLFAYTLATMGAFAVLSALGTRGDRNLQIEDLGGLWTVRPGLTLAMSTFMLALLGFPVFGGIGFFAKWYMLQAALRGGAAPQTRLAVVLVVTSVISAGYYLYVVAVMFMRPRAPEAVVPARLGRLTGTVLTVSAALILIFGFAPTQVLRAMNRSALQGTLDAARAAVARTP